MKTAFQSGFLLLAEIDTFTVMKVGNLAKSVLIICTLVLCACSNFSALSTSSVEIHQSLQADVPDILLEEVSSSPFVYKFQSAERTIHFTTLRECGFDPKTALVSTTRQLFIGFDNLRITHQEKTELGDELALISVAYAEHEKHPIRIVTYSTHREKCVTDVVFWTNGDTVPANALAQGNFSQTQLLNGEKEYFEQLVSAIINGKLAS